jgi:hypothetical protein
MARIRLLRAVQPAVIYYYSRYERTIYRKLQARYPEYAVPTTSRRCSIPTRGIDLYNGIIAKLTEWPTRDHSIA